jgi:hypothetical protein
VIGAVGLLGSVWTLGILRLGTCAVLVVFRRWQHLLAFVGSVLVVGLVVRASTPAGLPGHPCPRVWARWPARWARPRPWRGWR